METMPSIDTLNSLVTTLDAHQDTKMLRDAVLLEKDLAGRFVTIPPVIQPDGKILTCGSQSTGSASGTDFFVSRFTANGVLDTSFSFDGKVTIDFDGGGGGDLCTGIALQADGKIVAVGYTGLGTTLITSCNSAPIWQWASSGWRSGAWASIR